MLDASAIVVAGIEGIHEEQAKLTFAAARHAVVDLAQLINAQYDPSAPDRLDPSNWRNSGRHLSSMDCAP